MKCIEGCNAECCGIVPIPVSTYKKFKNRIKKKVIDKVKISSYIMLMTEDMSCAYLDDHNRCSIYKHRPLICKLYGTIEELQCPYIDIHGHIRDEKDVTVAKELIASQCMHALNMMTDNTYGQPYRRRGQWK